MVNIFIYSNPLSKIDKKSKIGQSKAEDFCNDQKVDLNGLGKTKVDKYVK